MQSTHTHRVESALFEDSNLASAAGLVPKGSGRLGGLDDMIVSLYAGGMTVRDIEHHLVSTIRTEISPETISKIIDEVLAWQKRPLESFYPVIYRVQNQAHRPLLNNSLGQCSVMTLILSGTSPLSNPGRFMTHDGQHEPNQNADGNHNGEHSIGRQPIRHPHAWPLHCAQEQHQRDEQGKTTGRHERRGADKCRHQHGHVSAVPSGEFP